MQQNLKPTTTLEILGVTMMRRRPILISFAIAIVLFHSLVSSSSLLVLTEEAGPDQRIEVGVYYESRCPDSRNFFLNQLLPTYRIIGNQTIKLLLVPFGHARVLSVDKMICQHGYRECEGNKLFGCMLAQQGASNDSEILESIGCIFENSSSSRDCIEKKMPKVSYNNIEQCTKNNTQVNEMMLKFEQMTGRVSYVPHLTINGESSDEIQQEAEWNLKNYICKIYKGSKPEDCKASASSPEVATS